MPQRLARIAAVLILLPQGAPSATEDSDPIQRGAALLQRNCAGCHAIGHVGDSPLPEAPPFRDLKPRYPIEDLAEPLAEGIVSGHPAMPERAFAPEDVDAILAYLNTL